MAYCSQCGAEYMDDITQCPDCFVDLADRFPEENVMEFDDKHNWVPIEDIPETLSLGRVIEKLEEREIPRYVKSVEFGVLQDISASDLLDESATIYIPDDTFEVVEEMINNLIENN